MKLPICVALLLTVSLPVLAAEPDFSVDGPGLDTLPDAVDKAIRAQQHTFDLSGCALVGKAIQLSDEESMPSDYVATTPNACGWTSPGEGPIWVMKSVDDKYKLVMNFNSHSLSIEKDVTNDLHNLRTSMETHDEADVEFWAFGEKKYQKAQSYKFTSKDAKTCREHQDLCPFVVDKNDN